MNIERSGGTGFLAWLFAGFFVCMPLTASAGDDEWKFKAQVYGWLPTIESTLPNDDDLKLNIDDILDYLDFTFMGVFQARKGDWAVVSDAVYLKISTSEAGNTTVPVGPFNVPTRAEIGVEMETWIVSLAGAYRIHQADKFDVQVLAGARYLSLDIDAELDTSLLPGEKLVSGRDDVWDAIVGVRGLAELSDKWWLTYRFDIGTGGSDQTWNAIAQFGRKFDWGSLAVGYRYLHYDFDSDFKLLKDLDVYGPVIGVAWEF